MSKRLFQTFLLLLPVLGLCAGVGMAAVIDLGEAVTGQAIQMGGIGTAGLFGLGGAAAGQLLRETFDDPTQKPGGPGVVSEEEFQQAVVGGMERQKRQLDQLTSNYDNLDKQTKQAFEDLTKVKNDFDGLGSQVQAAELAMKKIRLNLANEQRQAFGSPADRILKDEEKKTLFSAMVRQALGAPMTEEHKQALTGLATPGSTYVNDALITDVYDSLGTYGVWNSFAVRNVSTKNNKFPVKTARPVAKFYEQGMAITEDSNKAGTTEMVEAKGIKVLLSVANELLEDSEIDLTQDLLIDFLEAIAFRMDFACLTADGTNDDLNGSFTGIFEAGVSAVAATGRTNVADTTLEDWTAAMLACDEGVLARQTNWWIHPQQLVRALSVKDGNGRSIFLTATEVPTPAGIGSILGAGVIPSFAAPSADGPGSKIATFGEPNGQVSALRKGFDFRDSMHAAFAEDETAFRGIARFGNKARRASAFGVLETAAI